MNTYTYLTSWGRDRDDWSRHTIQASTRDEAIHKASLEWMGTGYWVVKKTFKIISKPNEQ